MFRSLRVALMALPMLLPFAAGHSQVLAPYPTATLTVNGNESQTNGVWASGNITIDFNGYVEMVNYGQYSSGASLASALAASFTRDFVSMGLYAKAGAHGPLVDPTVITFQLVNGSNFAPINIVNSSPFSFNPSGFASSTATVADRGTATLTVAGTTFTANYGDGSTAATIAQDLASQAATAAQTLRNSGQTPLVTVTAEGNNLYLQSVQTTGTFTYPYSLSFSTSTSFSGTPLNGNLTNATDTQTVPVYNYSATYDAASNLQTLNDSVMGNWSYAGGYDSLNRLVSGSASSGPYANQYTCWSYDSFGNRKSQSVSTTPCTGNPPATFSALYSANNQISSVSAPAGMSITYDAAGNITNDGYNSYTYDAEGRVCALNGSQGMIGYQYGPDGTRIGKGTVTNWQSCDITSNGYTPITDYVLDQGGGQMTEVAVGNGTWTPVHTNVTANGMLIATYDTLGLHFYLNDALGSRRAQTDSAGFPEQICQSLPFGDQLYCTGSLTNPTEHHFTGKERDAESGLDNFGARYMSSNMGRFSSPDPSGLAFADPMNPQSVNLYSYVLNNPLIHIDPNGLSCGDTEASGNQFSGGPDGTSPTPPSGPPQCAQPPPPPPPPCPTGSTGGTDGRCYLPSVTFFLHYNPRIDPGLTTLALLPGNSGDNRSIPRAPNNVPPVGACTAASCHIPGYVRPKSCDVDACTPAEKARWCGSAKATNAAINTAIGGDYTPFSTFIRFTPIGKFLGPAYAAQSVMKAGVSYTSSYINSVCSQ